MNLFLRYIQFDQNQFEKQKRIINLKEFFSKKKYIGLPNIFGIKSIKFGGFYIRLSKSNKKSSYHLNVVRRKQWQTLKRLNLLS
ncbi:hypothetical protein GS518_17860 [Leptospira interrogans]|uniref:Uncharacterized protein n=4 Tax=Pseudomonadati TaxID=3379134 RepID=A0AAP9WFI9_LEPIR|nr:hypothetical protein A6J42_00080 [Leptospira interrogans serovar Copenhageni]ASV07932.1 hypothetical protein B2G47_19955 [Leptospira interrogans serovar Canicola]KAA1264184.1 hypothetical protein C5473_21095 [Leptospira interrogans serovar Weerasinghe]KAA1293543.1 hypothetical protein C4X99_00140 [Leptospira interrogans serovar Geyaweera]MBE0301730.1 hypothetical protein [Leptospira interrogans serovar Yeoncheon]OMH62318.1 hypothetical protein BW243_18975 [Leptospira interrogans serovar Pom